MIQLKSRWASQVNADNALPEYPRPGLVRDSYLNLNGAWEYCINGSPTTEFYDGTILVPYAPESLLSGVRQTVTPRDYLHYRKIFTLPEGFKKDRVILHFGAVDQECTVCLNGTEVGKHWGGYNAFSFDITADLVEGENVLTVCVTDATEKLPHARGKQKLEKKGRLSSLFYTPQSGIWKTVWLESVPQAYIEKVKITPIFDENAIRIHVCTKGAADKAVVTVMDGDVMIKNVIVGTNHNYRINLDYIKPWTPDNPHLYDIRITYGEDTVSSYFGMRKLTVEKDAQGIPRFCLNNEPIFFNGVLDQGYWPESLMTPPTDEALKYDIQQLKNLGYNTIRKHVKVESERFYYHCDKLGMLVWQDMPNGGGEYNMTFMAYMPNAFEWFGRSVKDDLYKTFAREDAWGRAQYYIDLEGMVEELYNHPCIAAWVPFNEGWGQFDANAATEHIRKLDSTRFINEACGWFDQKGGDMYSIHHYYGGMRIKPQKERVVALTEFGGYACPVPGHMACEKEFGYKHYQSKEELTVNYMRLWEKEVYPNIARGMCAAIYTQTSDIEEEINGLMTYDREELKLVESEVRKVNENVYRIFKETVKL